jgi:hypothetical protein
VEGQLNKHLMQPSLSGLKSQKGLAFVGVGGAIDDVVNPTLRVRNNAVVQVTLINGDRAEHPARMASFLTYARSPASGWPGWKAPSLLEQYSY